MPEPKKGESEQDFVSRCVPIVMGEGADQEAALGKCYGIFRNANKALGTVDTMADAQKFNDSEAGKAEKDHAGERELKPGDGQPGSGTKIVPGEDGTPKAAPAGAAKSSVRLVRAFRLIQRSMVVARIVRVGKNLAVDPVELYEGTCEELEHTSDWHQAMQIAMDHLAETPDYYARLKEAGLMGEDDGHPPLEVVKDDEGAAMGRHGIGDIQAEEVKDDAATTLGNDN